MNGVSLMQTFFVKNFTITYLKILIKLAYKI